MPERVWDMTEGLPEEVPQPGASVWHQAPEGKASVHFAWSEICCHHCGRVPNEGECQQTAVWLEKVRVALGNRRIFCNSWARCETHNRAVGGAPNSYHLKGWAVDITVDGLTPAQAHRELAKLQGTGKLIGGLGRYPSFCHVDRGIPRRWNGP